MFRLIERLGGMKPWLSFYIIGDNWENRYSLIPHKGYLYNREFSIIICVICEMYFLDNCYKGMRFIIILI